MLSSGRSRVPHRPRLPGLATLAPAIALGLLSACETLPPDVYYMCPEDLLCLPPGYPIVAQDPGSPPDAIEPPLAALPPIPDGSSVRLLQYGVVDAVQDPSSGALVVVSDTNELVVIDPTSGIELHTPLPSSPLAVSVSPDGKLAAVAYVANVSVVDLATRTISATCPTAATATDVVIDNDARVYLLSGQPDFSVDTLTRVDSKTCTTPSTRRVFGSVGSAVFSGSDRTLYYLAGDLVRCPVGTDEDAFAPLDCAAFELDHGGFDRCAGFWLDETGRTLFTSCGQRVHLPAPDSNNMQITLGTTFDELQRIDALVASSAHDRVLLVGSSTLYRTVEQDRELAVLNLYDATTLERTDQLGLPKIPSNAGAVLARGRFVFADAPMHHAYVLMDAQADASSTRTALAVVPLPERDEPLADAGASAIDAEVPDAADASL